MAINTPIEILIGHLTLRLPLAIMLASLVIILLLLGCEQDSQSPGFTISPTSGLITTENGGTVDFDIVLNTKPDAMVTISLRSSNTGEGILSGDQVSFSAANWSNPQSVTITGVDDNLSDGDTVYHINFPSIKSDDKRYAKKSIESLMVINLDNEIAQPPPKPTAGVTVVPTVGLVTSENQTSASFSVLLTSPPTSEVTITAVSSNINEGVVSPLSHVFTGSNWDTAAVFTVTGVDDNVADGNKQYSITLTAQSSDPSYNGINIAAVQLQNLDNEVPGITINSNTPLETFESGTSTSFTVVLNSLPTANVSISIASSNTSEGVVSPANLTFTSSNWNLPQTVTVTGVDDNAVDGDINYDITFGVQSSDTYYSGMAIPPLSAVNHDNDSPGITINPSTPFETSENLTTATFTAVLHSLPSANVSINITSSDPTEATASPAILTFTSSDWNNAQSVIVTGVDDSEVDGDISYNISFSVQSTDALYNDRAIASLSAVNLDNDTNPPKQYSLYIKSGTIDIAASTITGNGAAILPSLGFSLSNSLPSTTPGPTIEAVEGQPVTINVTNNHSSTHHFSIEGLLSNPTELLPGETKQFQFTATQAGVYRYADPQLPDRALGLHGAAVVRPANSPNSAWTGGPVFTQERTWVISDFDETWLRNPSGINTFVYNPNYFLLNGKSGFAASQDTASTIDGNVGDTFLVRIVNAGQYDQSLHFHSHHVQVISQGGIKPTNIADAPFATTVNVKHDSTAMILLTLDKTGTYPVNTQTAQMQTGNGVYLNGARTNIIGR